MSVDAEIKTLIAGDGDVGQRLDVFLAKSGLLPSRSAVKSLLSEAAVTVSGNRSKPSYKMKRGDAVEIRLGRSLKLDLVPEAIPLGILYEDRDIVVLNKAPGMVVHPSVGQTRGTLVHALLAHAPEMVSLGQERPGIVHRLDKGTSGVMVVAKNSWALVQLARQFKDREVKKKYFAIVHGLLPKSKGEIVNSIGRHPVDRKRMSVLSRRGREARTEWAVLKMFRKFTLVELVIRTGRTHQIRVHLAHLGHPVLGDALYGGRMARNDVVWIGRPALHSRVLGFHHPRTLEQMEFEAPLAEDMQAALRKIQSLELDRSDAASETHFRPASHHRRESLARHPQPGERVSVSEQGEVPG